MDPIREGNKIFKKISDSFQTTKITDFSEIKTFFEILMKKTNGWVILDFLDAANWDKIETFDFNEQNGILTLIWHDYRNKNESKEEKELRQMVFPASLYSLSIAINSIVIIKGADYAIFLLNGFAKTEKDIKKLCKKNADMYKIFDNSFFEKRINRLINDHLEVIDFHCTPLYSLAIIPKNLFLHSLDSKKILYQYNLNITLKRIKLIVEFLKDIDPNNHDLICEKVNTARRIFEQLLKIVCCYRKVNVKGNYSQLELGPLIKYVKNSKNDIFNNHFGKMVKLLNQFSHDTGTKIELINAQQVCYLVMTYTQIINLEIKELI